jgi:hypothetical protein
MESLTFFGVSMEYFGVSNRHFITSCLFHFGITMEFPTMCAVRHNFRKPQKSAVTLENILKKFENIQINFRKNCTIHSAVTERELLDIQTVVLLVAQIRI